MKCEHCGSPLKIASHTGELKAAGRAASDYQSVSVVRRKPMSKARKRTIIISFVFLVAAVAVGLKIYNEYNWVRVVNSVALSPDGRRIVSVHGQGRSIEGGTVRIWDATNGKELNTILRKDELLWQVAWSPDGRYVATGGHDSNVEVFNAESFQVTQTLKGTAGFIDNLAWSPDSSRIAVGDDKGRLRVWNVENGESVYSELIHTNKIDAVAWSSDGKRIATGGWDNMIRVVDLSTAKELFAVADTSYVDSVAWSEDGRLLAAGGLSNLIRIIDTQSGKELFALPGHKNSVRQVAWSPSGTLLVSLAADDTLRVWDVESGKVVQALDNPGYNQNFQWSLDGKYIASGGRGTIRIWETENWTPRTLKGYSESNDVRIVAWSTDGKYLLTVGTYDEEITLWDVAQEKKLHTMQVSYWEAFRKSVF